MRGHAKALPVLAAVFVASLALASAANASSTFIGWYGNEPFPSSLRTVGGGMDEPRDVAVNSTGAGGVPAGTTYVADMNNNRIDQFGPLGNFVRAWGINVVESGEDQADAIQRLTVNATGGTFTLTFNAATTADISATATAGEVQSALNALSSISTGGGSVSVTGGPGNAGGTSPYIVTFDGGPLGGTSQTLLSAANGSVPLSGAAATATVVSLNPGGNGFEICNANPPSNDVCRQGNGSFGTAIAGALSSPQEIAVSQVSGNVFVPNRGRIEVYSGSGQILRAFGSNAIASGPDNATPTSAQQTINVPGTVTGGTFTLSFGGKTTGPIAYNADASTVQTALVGLASIGSGNISVSGGPGATAPFLATFAGSLANNPEPLMSVDSSALVGDVASVTNTTTGVTSHEICVYPVDLCQSGGTGGSPTVAPPGAPNEGNVLLAGSNRVSEYTALGAFVRAVGFDVVAAGPNNNGTTNFEGCVAADGDACKSGTSGGSPGQFSGPQKLDVDASGDIYTVEFGRLQKLTPQPGNPGFLPTAFASGGGTDIAVGPAGHVFVSRAFPSGASTCPEGEPSIGETRVLEFTADGLTLVDTHIPCSEFKGVSVSTETRGIDVDSATGWIYVVKAGENRLKRVFAAAPDPLPDANVLSIDEITQGEATIHATVKPNISPGFTNSAYAVYTLQYKLSSDSSWTTFDSNVPVGAGFSAIPITAYLAGLNPNSSYDVRLLATKELAPTEFATQKYLGGIKESPVATFATEPGPPRIDAFFTSKVSATSADLHAKINPLGQDTSYRFEYGTTPEYGTSVPIPDEVITASQSSEEVVQGITGLNGGTYHFRVVATNDSGTTVTGDQTFNFYPPSCPNESLRQQTGASYLPDCRGYELVSPPQAGNVILFPVSVASFSALSVNPTATDATAPARFAYSGIIGGIEGSGDFTAVINDTYVATRMPTEWVTRYTGRKGSEGSVHGGPPPAEDPSGFAQGLALGDRKLDRFIDWDYGQKGFGNVFKEGSYAPYLYDSEGNFLTRLPTNVSEVPGAEDDLIEGGFNGDAKPSPDFTHYVFSTPDLVFAPGGLIGAPGSVYDNNVDDGSVVVVSKTETDQDIPAGTGGSNEVIRIPAVSTDGSHILMSTKGGSGTHLYMSIDRGPALDVSLGKTGENEPVNFIGMTDDGEVVYFSTALQMTADDHDTSVDLFQWRADAPDSLTRVSEGPAAGGDTDSCIASWTAKCNAVVVSPGASTDDVVSTESGDVYFYSPERLIGGKGVPGQKNLYVYREGTLQFVAALPTNAVLDRIQIVPNGRYMAMLTRAKLTAYDNQNFLEMYTYDAESGAIQCVSCVPDGTPPTKDVEASQNGIFLTNDGRAFFTTGDPLVAQDINGKLRDVYEFVENRPQLISSGAAPRDFERIALGLIGVSRDGVNVYFSTIESLVGQDLNGPFLKFYDARTGGGFPFVPPGAPCGAADECHGPASSAPAALPAGTGASLGDGGNQQAAKKRKGKKRRARHRKKKGHRSATKPGNGKRRASSANGNVGGSTRG